MDLRSLVPAARPYLRGVSSSNASTQKKYIICVVM